MSYTEAELKAAVSEFVRSELKNERTALGPLSTDNVFQEVMEFASSTLVFDPSAVFYLMSLIANNVNRDVLQAIELLDDVIQAIAEMGRQTKEVTRTSLLEDAASSLLEAERILTEKGALTQSQLSRYERATDEFVDVAIAPNIRNATGQPFPNTYEIVRTPQEAQTSMRSSTSDLSELHTQILGYVDQMQGMLTEFNSLDLPKLAIQTAINKVRIDLRALKAEFDAATKDGAIELTHDAYLRIRAGSAVIKNLQTIADPLDPRMSATTSDTFSIQAADGEDEIPALISTGRSAPYLIDPTTNELVLALDSGSPVTITLEPEDPAYILGSKEGPFDIHGDSAAEIVSTITGPYTVPASPNNVFKVYVDGDGYEVTLTDGSRTATEVAGEINSATRIDGASGTFGDVATASDDGGVLVLTHDTEGEFSIVIGNQTTLNTALGFTDDQQDIGTEDNTQIAFSVDHLPVLVNLTEGSRSVEQIAADIVAASSSITAGQETVEALPSDIVVLRVGSVSYGEGSYITVVPLNDTHRNAMETLGFTDLSSARSEYFQLSDLEDAINAVSGVSAVQKQEVLQSGTNGEAIYDAGEYRLRLPVGTITDLTVNDTLRITGGANAGWYLIESIRQGVTSDTITVSRPFTSVTGDEALNQGWETHRDLLDIQSDGVGTQSRIEVQSGSANDAVGLNVGTYYGTVSGLTVTDSGKLVDVGRYDVRAGDIVTIGGSQYEVTSLSNDGYQMEVTPEAQNNLVSQSFLIESEGALAYADFIIRLSDWAADLDDTRYSENILELERRLNPLLTSRNPAAVWISDADNAASDLRTLYTDLSTILEEFTTSEVIRINAMLDMLVERGLDRAHDQLLLGEFETFFSMTQDSGSYGGNLLEKMRSIAQNDVPVTTDEDEDHVDSREIGTFTEADADFDFSDADDERGFTEIDDLPDTDDEDFLNQSL